MTYTIERFTQGVWAPVSHQKSKELAEADDLGITGLEQRTHYLLSLMAIER